MALIVNNKKAGCVITWIVDFSAAVNTLEMLENKRRTSSGHANYHFYISGQGKTDWMLLQVFTQTPIFH